jgi:hypothetical protein
MSNKVKISIAYASALFGLKAGRKTRWRALADRANVFGFSRTPGGGRYRPYLIGSLA